MGGNHAVWSLKATQYSSPSAVALQSLCKHAPLRSITAVLTPVPIRHAHQQGHHTAGTGSNEPAQQHGQNLRPQLLHPQQRGATTVQPAAFLGFDSDGCTLDLQQDVCPRGRGSMGRVSTSGAGRKTHDLDLPSPIQHNQVLQWQLVTPSVQGLLPNAIQLAAAQATSIQDAATADVSLLPGALQDSSLSSPQLHNKADGQQQTQQPTALSKLIAVSRYKQQVKDHELAQILQQVQQLMPQLPLYQLAYAAWAAAELSQQQPCSQGWLQQLYTAAAQHFKQVSNVVDEAAVATLLQALVKLEQLPSQQWLAECCDSLAVEKWHTPRALSTVAACLPQLGCVPDDMFCEKFFRSSAAQLSAFPAISAARMLHGVVAWRYLQQQQVPERQQEQLLLHIPDSWLFSVLRQLFTHSSQLKPAEMAMVLQAMQRLQQQRQLPASSSQQAHEPLVPAPGQQPATLLQQTSQQLLHALLAAVLQQLPRFKCKDLTVMLFSVSCLMQQQLPEGGEQVQQQQVQQPGVQWSWLRQVLSAAQVEQLDARGQATCLGAASMLVKPHLILEQQQQRGFFAPAAASEQQSHQQHSELPTAKPLQRWLQLQKQQQQQPAPAPEQAASLPAVRHPSPRQILAVAGAQQQHTTVSSFWQQWLDRFYEQSRDALRAFSREDLTVSLCALASLRQVPPVDWYEGVLDAVQQRLPHMSPGQAAGIAWSLGTMALLPSQHDAAVSLVPADSWMRRLYLGHGPAQLQQGQQQLAVEQEGVLSGSHVAVTLSSCSAPEVVRFMWAAGVCECDVGDAWWAGAEQQLLKLAAAAYNRHSTSSSRVVADVRADQQAQQPLLSIQLLTLLCRAYAAAGRTLPAELLQQLLLSPAVLRQLLLPAPVSALSALLKSLGQCQPELPAEWLQQLGSALQPRLAVLGPQELLQLMEGWSAVGFKPHQHGNFQPSDCQTADAAGSPPLVNSAASSNSQTTVSCSNSGSSWAAVCLAVTQHKMQHMSASDVSYLMWMVVKLQLKPPAPWLEAALHQIQAGFLDAQPSTLGLAITAASKLGYMPSSDWMAGFLMATHRKAAAMAADPNSNKPLLARFVLMTLWALADLRVRSLSPKWLKLMLLTVHQQLPLLQPHHSLALLQVLARLQCRPSPVFLQSLLGRMGDCSNYSSSELVKVVYAAAALRWQPSKHWCKQFLAASTSRLAELDPQGLALLHWSLAVIKVTPPESWKNAAVAAVMLQLDCLNATDVSMIVWSWCKLQIHLTPRQELSRAEQRALRQQFKLWLQQRWKQKSGGVSEQQQQLHNWRQHYLQQQWQAWRQMQPRPQLVSPGGFSSLAARELVPDRVLEAAYALRGSYSMSSLVHLLVGVARLQLRPSQEWLQSMVLLGSTQKLSVLNGLQLQQLVWALAKLGYRAQQQWLDGVAVLLEVAWQENDYVRHSAAAAVVRLQQLVLH